MFYLVLTMSVGVLFTLGGAVKKNRLRNRKQKVDFLKIQKLIRADKKQLFVTNCIITPKLSELGT